MISEDELRPLVDGAASLEAREQEEPLETTQGVSGSLLLAAPLLLLAGLRKWLFRRSDLNPGVAIEAGKSANGAECELEHQTPTIESESHPLDDCDAEEPQCPVETEVAGVILEDSNEALSPRSARESRGELAAWSAISSAVVGDSHRQIWPPIPCQDFCTARAEQRPFLVLADGLGSAPLSHLGADQIVRMTSCFILARNHEISRMLDQEQHNDTSERIANFVESLYSFAAYLIADLAGQVAHQPSSFRTTLLFVIVGEVSVLWAQLGDGAIVVQDTNGVKCISPRKDASWVNVVSALGGPEELREPAYGILSSADIRGIAALSDGAAERLVSSDHGKVAGRLAKFWEGLRSGEGHNREVRNFLLDPEIWSATTGDDKAIAMLAR